MDLTELSDDQAEFLRGTVTDATSPVYFFTDDLPAPVVGAAMARFSRSPDDLRVTIAREFAPDVLGRVQDLIGRVVGQYGDDSVQQLVPIQFVVEGASNLLTKLLEWSRLMSYLEQSTRYIPFDQRDATGNFKYYVPDELSDELRAEYRSTMDEIFATYSELIRVIQAHVADTSAGQRGNMTETAWNNATRAQALDAVRTLLPVATRSSVGFVGNAQSLENLYYNLKMSGLEEASQTANALLSQARRLPYLEPFVRRADLPDRGAATVAYRSENHQRMREFVADFLATETTPIADTGAMPLVRLLKYSPDDELDILPYLMLPYADGWDLESLKKALYARDWASIAPAVISRYIGDRTNRRHKPGRAIERATFEWEITGDYGTFRDLQRHRMLSAFEWQRLTPHYGYVTPDLVVQAGVEDQYRHCFEQAEALFARLVDAGLPQVAQYATLLGHNMRYTFQANLRELFHMLELRTQPAGHPGYRRICQMMYEQLQRVYPHFAAGMIFMNTTGELTDLTRLEEERRNQNRPS